MSDYDWSDDESLAEHPGPSPAEIVVEEEDDRYLIKCPTERKVRASDGITKTAVWFQTEVNLSSLSLARPPPFSLSLVPGLGTCDNPKY